MYYGLINSMNKGAGYTARTQALITATGLSDAIKINAINTFDLAIQSIESKLTNKALYLLFLENSTWNARNFLGNSTFDLTFSGGLTHLSSGILPNGVNGYANTNFKNGTHLTSGTNYTLFFQSMNDSNTGVDIGSYNVANATPLDIEARYGGAIYAGKCSLNGYMTASNTDGTGVYINTRLTNSDTRLYKNGILQDSSTTNIASTNNIDNYLFARNDSGAASFYSSKKALTAGIIDGLTVSEVSILNSALSNLKTNLGL